MRCPQHLRLRPQEPPIRRQVHHSRVIQRLRQLVSPAQRQQIRTPLRRLQPHSRRRNSNNVQVRHGRSETRPTVRRRGQVSFSSATQFSSGFFRRRNVEYIDSNWGRGCSSFFHVNHSRSGVANRDRTRRRHSDRRRRNHG